MSTREAHSGPRTKVEREILQRERAESAGKAQKYEKRKREGKREEERERESRARESRAGSPSEGKACRATSRPGKRRPSHGSQPVTWLRHGCGCHAAIIIVVVVGKGNARTDSLPRPMYAYVLFPQTAQKAACLLPTSLQSYILPLQSLPAHPSPRWGLMLAEGIK